jgi:hypothetical protein
LNHVGCFSFVIEIFSRHPERQSRDPMALP